MAGPGPRFVIDPPPIVPPLLSLWTMAARPTAEEDREERWGNGISFRSESCGTDVDAILAGCAEGDTTKGSGVLRETVDVDPFLVFAPYTCGAMSGISVEEYHAEARRLLNACWVQQLEREFWMGSIVTGNPNLTSADTNDLSGGTAMDLDEAIAALEEGLDDCSCGGPGMIHMTTRQFSLASATEQIIVPDNNPAGGVAMTKRGTYVVPGVGYTGANPSGATPADSEYIYATGRVKVFRGRDIVFPDTIGEALNRTNNQITFRAEMAVLYAYDPCCQLGAKVDSINSGGS